jgi:hypothetical protein
MANDKTIILHRRSAVSGSKPITSDLRVGEIGLNTYDGKAFIHKSGSVDEIVDIVVAGSNTSGDINILGTGSFGELNVTNDFNVSGSIFVNGDVVGLGDVDFAGAVTASFFVGDGRYLTGITASMRPDDFDFNSDPFAGSIGYIQGSGSLYKVAAPSNGIEFRYDDVPFATFTSGSTSLYGIGDILVFSGSVASRLAAVEAGMDGGTF